MRARDQLNMTQLWYTVSDISIPLKPYIKVKKLGVYGRER